MIKQYLQFCEEEKFDPLSRATLFRILEVREASQQRSLSGLDNMAADGSAGFERLSRIVDELDPLGLEKSVADELRSSLRDGKKYFKTEYQSHCQDDESQCPDHCRKFGLSDPIDPDFQEHCTHQHTLRCSQCDDIASCLHKIQQIVKVDKTMNFYSKEQQDDLLYDIEKATESIFQWKAHIMRSVNQECAKQDVLTKLTDQSSCLIVMDWAMKFLQLRYREKQSDWYGKRGLSWHISSVISRGQSDTIEVISYAHLFDQCTQDWYAVVSIIEDLLTQLKARNPLLQKVCLRSDEAGCYHNSSLIAAVRDVAKRVGVQVHSYHFSEPQSGKDICDRILCPMKSSIRTYCNEGHDVLTATEMREALKQHPVKGTTTSISTVDETKKNLAINKIENFSSFHNFEHEDSGLRVWKCYGMGSGKYIPYESLCVKYQGPTMLQTKEGQGFYDPSEKREVKCRPEANRNTEIHTPLYECSVPGCTEAFDTFAQLELHLDVGKHTKNQYDAIRRDWALKFSSVDTASKGCTSLESNLPESSSKARAKASSSLQTGWALTKARSTTRFSQKVKEYLTARFMLGERTGRKADPSQVATDMRTTRTSSNERQFSRSEWMSKTQVQSFFSRLVAVRRKDQGVVGLSADQEKDVQCLQENSDRQELVDAVNEEINVKHPINYDMYDLCERYQNDTLQEFNMAMLKTICSHFEIPVKTRDKKKMLINKLSDMISECECVSHS
ncbi:hypothetical protein QZH41_000682 [Actinostola sp. cb2023]|nr:hypothetical protein QZH41_000682 [Actinostola sp. cb2023]